MARIRAGNGSAIGPHSGRPEGGRVHGAEPSSSTGSIARTKNRLLPGRLAGDRFDRASIDSLKLARWAHCWSSGYSCSRSPRSSSVTRLMTYPPATRSRTTLTYLRMAGWTGLDARAKARPRGTCTPTKSRFARMAGWTGLDARAKARPRGTCTPTQSRFARLAGWTGLEPATSDVTGENVR
jgi:hypothetical protein